MDQESVSGSAADQLPSLQPRLLPRDCLKVLYLYSPTLSETLTPQSLHVFSDCNCSLELLYPTQFSDLSQT